jgi:hypothetical protein
MCTGRLQRRVPSARPLFVAQLRCHVLRFHKRSTDGSGKADSEYTGKESDVVRGVLFELDAAEKGALDEAEGLGSGYEEKTVSLRDYIGQTYSATTYFASDNHKDRNLRPYSWYLRFVLEGAKQHSLPAEYMKLIDAVEAIEDPNHARDSRNRQIDCA